MRFISRLVFAAIASTVGLTSLLNSGAILTARFGGIASFHPGGRVRVVESAAKDKTGTSVRMCNTDETLGTGHR